MKREDIKALALELDSLETLEEDLSELTSIYSDLAIVPGYSTVTICGVGCMVRNSEATRILDIAMRGLKDSIDERKSDLGIED